MQQATAQTARRKINLHAPYSKWFLRIKKTKKKKGRMTERKSIERQLKSAAKSGDVGRVSELLSKGEVNLDCRDRNGSTPLHHAAGQGQIAVLKLLCRKGASVGTQNKEGQTALHEAAHQGHENCVAYLLRKGADTEHRDKDGATPLHNAAFRGHDRCVQHLIKEGANVNAIDQQVVDRFHQVSHVFREGSNPCA